MPDRDAIRFGGADLTGFRLPLTLRCHGSPLGATVSAQVDIADNDDANPVAVADNFAVAEDNAVAGDVSTNDLSLANTPVTFTVTTGVTNGSLTLNANGTFTYTPNANFNGVDSFTYQVQDVDGDVSTAGVTITVTAVNDAPVPGNNTFTINDGGTLGIASGNLSATDVDNTAGTLAFPIGGITHGHFELVSGPGVVIATFTQQQILNGEVRFVHDGSGLAPTFSIQVTDGTVGVGPFAANVVFNGGGGFTPPPAPPGGGGGGPTTVTPPVVPPTPPAPPLGTPGAGGQGGLRSPTGLGDAGEAEVIVTQSAPGAAWRSSWPRRAKPCRSAPSLK